MRKFKFKVLLIAFGSIFYCAIYSAVLHSAGLANKPTEPSHQKESLKGLKEMIFEVNIGLSREGPTREKLNSIVERQFRKAGIRVFRKEKDVNLGNVPFFLIEVSILKSGKRPYAYFVMGQLRQKVILDRHKEITTFSPTWHMGIIREGDLENISEDVKRVTNFYLRDYLAVNSIVQKREEDSKRN